MVYSTRNRSNDTTEIRKKKMLVFSTVSQKSRITKVYSWNKLWSLISLAMLKCESRTSLHAVQYK